MRAIVTIGFESRDKIIEFLEETKNEHTPSEDVTMVVSENGVRFQSAGGTTLDLRPVPTGLRV